MLVRTGVSAIQLLSTTIHNNRMKDGDVTEFFKGFKDVFERGLEDAYGGKAINLIKSFKQAAMGFGDELPIHYPRVQPERKEEEENYQWFTNNFKESKKNNKGGKRLPLPLLTNEMGLPYKADHPK